MAVILTYGSGDHGFNVVGPHTKLAGIVRPRTLSIHGGGSSNDGLRPEAGPTPGSIAVAEAASEALDGISRAIAVLSDRFRREGAIKHDTDDGRFSTQQRKCGRSVAALGEQNIGKLYRKIRRSAGDSLLQLLPSFTQFN